MSAQHTPDLRLPWRAYQASTGFWEVWTRQNDEPGNRNNYAIAVGIQDEAEANLLASSGELLEACAALIACHDSGGTDAALALGRAAIAKAGGAR